MTDKRFTVEKIEIVSDHLSTRFFIVDNITGKSYDVQHIVSTGFEVQYDSWADKIADEWNTLTAENKQLNQDRTRLLNFLRRELEYDVGDEIYDILHNKFYDKVWWDEENEKITSEYIKKDHEEWIKPR